MKKILFAICAITIFCAALFLEKKYGTSVNPPAKLQAGNFSDNKEATSNGNVEKSALSDLIKSKKIELRQQQDAYSAEREKVVAEMHNFQSCHAARERIAYLIDLKNSCNSIPNKTAEDKTNCASDAQVYDEEIAKFRAQADVCKGDDISLLREYFNTVKKAAELGDSDAQVCYISYPAAGKIRGSDGSFARLFSDEDIQQYRSRATSYTESALSRGDWRVVKLFSVSAISLRGRGLLSQISRGDPYTVYQMNRLMRLGAEGRYANELDAEASYMEKATLLGEPEKNLLSPDQIVRANAEAKDIFNQYFSSSSKLSEAPNLPCG
jgi:hypothetical protein